MFLLDLKFVLLLLVTQQSVDSRSAYFVQKRDVTQGNEENELFYQGAENSKTSTSTSKYFEHYQHDYLKANHILQTQVYREIDSTSAPKFNFAMFGPLWRVNIKTHRYSRKKPSSQWFCPRKPLFPISPWWSEEKKQSLTSRRSKQRKTSRSNERSPLIQFLNN